MTERDTIDLLAMKVCGWSLDPDDDSFWILPDGKSRQRKATGQWEPGGSRTWDPLTRLDDANDLLNATTLNNQMEWRIDIQSNHVNAELEIRRVPKGSELQRGIFEDTQYPSEDEHALCRAIVNTVLKALGVEVDE